MATWTLSGFGVGNTSTAWDAAKRIIINTAFGLANSTAWSTDKKISVDSYNNYFHVLDTSASAAVDRCPRAGQIGHMQCISRGANAAQYNLIAGDGNTIVTGRTITTGSPEAYRCLEFHFNHVTAIMLDPVQIWSGSGDAVAVPLKAASVYFIESGTSVGRSWVEATPNAKLTLTSKTTLSTGHSIYIAMCAKIKQVSFNNNGRVKISATYS